jgi:hypothetical protein
VSVEEKVKNIIVEKLSVEPDEVVMAASFVDDLGGRKTPNGSRCHGLYKKACLIRY